MAVLSKWMRESTRWLYSYELVNCIPVAVPPYEELDHLEYAQAQPQSAQELSVLMSEVCSKLEALDDMGVFRHPVTEQSAPNYFKIIKKPMDLSTLRRNVDRRLFKSIHDFDMAVWLMFSNATVYNSPFSDIYKVSLFCVQMTTTTMIMIVIIMCMYMCVCSVHCQKIQRVAEY